MTELRQRSEIAAIVWVGVVAVYSTVVLPLIVSAVAAGIGVTPIVAGYVASAEMGGVAIGTLVAVPLVARSDRRRLVSVGALVGLIANLAAMLPIGFGGLLALRAASGAGSGFLLAAMAATAGDTRSPERVFGIFVAAAFLAAAASFGVLSGFVERAGAAPLYAILGGMNASAVVALRWFPSRGCAGASAGARPRTPRALPIAFALLGILCFYLGVGSAWPMMATLGRSFGLGGEQVAGIMAGTSIAALVGATGATLLAARPSKLAPLVVGLGATVASLAALLVWRGEGFFVLPLTFLLAWNFSVPFMMGALAAFDPSGRAVAFNMTLQYFGFAVGPLIAAAVATRAGLVAVLAIGVAGCGGALLCFASALLTARRAA
jgi:predicted MFS family arabinose efflux permease